MSGAKIKFDLDSCRLCMNQEKKNPWRAKILLMRKKFMGKNLNEKWHISTILKSLFSSSASFHAGLPSHGLFHCSVLMLTYTHRLSGLACLTSVAGIKDNLAFQQARRGTGFAILTAVFTLWHIFLWRIRMSWKNFDQLWRLGDKSVHRRGSRSGRSGFGRTTFSAICHLLGRVWASRY